MPSDQRNSTMAKATHLMFSLFNVALAQKVSFGTYNAFFMELPVPSFVFHSTLLTVKSVNLVVTHNGFLFVIENFILATLITQLLFKFSIHTGW